MSETWKSLTFSSLTSFYRYGFITFETSEEADQVRDKVRLLKVVVFAGRLSSSHRPLVPQIEGSF